MFLYMSGEFSVSFKIVMIRDRWRFTQSASKLIAGCGATIRRTKVDEAYNGVFYFCRSSYPREVENLQEIIKSGVICWPDPSVLQRVSDRHATMRECARLGLTTDAVFVGEHRDFDRGMIGDHDLVVKIGQEHTGIGKLRFTRGEEVCAWDGTATVERFYDGTSCRILVIGDDDFAIKVRNDSTWIKNDAGAEIDEWDDPPSELVAHARACTRAFNLDVCGVDYIIDGDGTFHFLELNQFPGWNATDRSCECARSFIAKRLDEIETVWDFSNCG